MDLEREMKTKDSQINRLLKAVQDKNLTVSQWFKSVNKNDEEIASVQEEVQQFRPEKVKERRRSTKKEGQEVFWV